MVDGLWIVQYHGPAGVGGGVVVFTKGQVLGGDSGFAYVGTYEEKGDVLKVRVSATHFDQNIPSVMGIPGNHDLIIEGKITGDKIDASGALAAYPDTKTVVQLSRHHKL
ncbi:MAG: hypothetical protein JSS69_06535 [Acidobacteria bacterium]|nr:hypothetical protein [Acidobacteriota bacterium]MBS1865561.1 hypothetical protein [Acidobacteriota bacterium]